MACLIPKSLPARASGLPLAYCPLQQGWVHHAEDEEETAPPLSWQVGALPLHKHVHRNARSMPGPRC
jgi:hypothetical protein